MGAYSRIVWGVGRSRCSSKKELPSSSQGGFFDSRKYWRELLRQPESEARKPAEADAILNELESVIRFCAARARSLGFELMRCPWCPVDLPVRGITHRPLPKRIVEHLKQQHLRSPREPNDKGATS